MKNMMVFEEYAKWLVLLSEMQRAVIASELGDVQSAMKFGQKQIETAAAGIASAPQAKTARAYMVIGKVMIINCNYAAAKAYEKQDLTLRTYFQDRKRNISNPFVNHTYRLANIAPKVFTERDLDKQVSSPATAILPVALPFIFVRTSLWIHIKVTLFSAY